MNFRNYDVTSSCIRFRLEADIFSDEMVDAAIRAAGCPHKLTKKRGFYEVLLYPPKGSCLDEFALGFNDSLVASVRLRL